MLATAVVLAVAVVIAGARFIDRVQSSIVIVLLAVFAIFIVVTLRQVDPQLLAPMYSPQLHDIQRCTDLLRLSRLCSDQLHRR